MKRFYTIGVVLFALHYTFLIAAEKQFSSQAQGHWAFQKITCPEVPFSSQTTWGHNDVDAFILRKIVDLGLHPSSAADKRTLVRRASLDLIGLPPTPEEVEAFVNDDSAAAFEHVVDRLLQSPHYGERWARHWLDLARYAESEGFKADETRPDVWRYRDYVIKSFNDDKPYDRFVEEQLAGDELWPDDSEARIATAFNRHYADESNARNLRQRRQEILNDITDTVGAVFTGLTYGCARCHDHKFDPILQKDYYRLQAFFANTAANDNIPLLRSDELAEYNRKLSIWEAATKDIRDQMAEIEEPKRKEIIQEYVEKYPEDIQAALAKKSEDRSAFECQMVAKAELYLNPTSHQYIASTSAVAGRLKGEQKKKWESLNGQLKEYQTLYPGKLPVATGINDLSADSPQTYVLARGNYDAPKEPVEPGFLTLLDPAPVKVAAIPGRPTTGRRATLAKVLLDANNPLTARVIVNRIWQHHFGRGLVASPSDFGMKGDRPTHPELLDWLASQFVKDGWSMKKLHKLIMLSAAYQQASTVSSEAEAIDPDNKYLSHFPRQRLEGEVIRDASLRVAGMLNPAMGGPSVFPELPPGMETRGGWKTNAKPEDRNRRSIYIFVRRNMRYPMFETFDMPDTHESCPRRNTTTSPLQALTMLNNKLTLEWAEAFADRVLQKAGNDASKQIETAYLMAYSRLPDAKERSIINQFFSHHAAILEERLINGEQVPVPTHFEANQEVATLRLLPSYITGDPGPGSEEKLNAATLVDLCHMLLNSNEFVYLN
jgi:hypothetical protein